MYKINKQTLLALAPALLVAATFIFSSAPGIISSANAQEDKPQPKYKDVKTRKRQSVGKACARRLEPTLLLI